MIYISIGLILAAIWYALVIANAIRPFTKTPLPKMLLTLGIYDADNEYENSNGDLFMLMLLSILVAILITIIWGFLVAVYIIYLIVKTLRDYVSPWNSKRY